MVYEESHVEEIVRHAEEAYFAAYGPNEATSKVGDVPDESLQCGHRCTCA